MSFFPSRQRRSSWTNLRSRTRSARRSFRPNLDVLEIRLTPTVHWTGAVSNDWDQAANWSPNGIPVASDEVVIDDLGANDFTVTHSSGASDSVKSLINHASLSLTGGSLSIATSSSIAGSLTLGNGGSLSGTGDPLYH